MTSKSPPEFPTLDPLQYLELAKRLALSPEPAERRTAADRAYYAAFLFSRDSLSAKGYLTPYYSSDDHRYVVETLKSLPVLGASGNDENRLRTARNNVTYDTRVLGNWSLRWFITTAETIIEKVKALPPRI